jgi:hypothetical protein
MLALIRVSLTSTTNELLWIAVTFPCADFRCFDDFFISSGHLSKLYVKIELATF